MRGLCSIAYRLPLRARPRPRPVSARSAPGTRQLPQTTAGAPRLSRACDATPSGGAAEAHSRRWLPCRRPWRTRRRPAVADGLRYASSGGRSAGSRVQGRGAFTGPGYACHPSRGVRGWPGSHGAALLAVGRDERERRAHARAQQAQHVGVVRQRRHCGHLPPELRAARRGRLRRPDPRGRCGRCARQRAERAGCGAVALQLQHAWFGSGGAAPRRRRRGCGRRRRSSP